MFEPFIFGLFGLIVGSFLNVVILREGKHSVLGRSACISCGATLAWHDLIPVLSWVSLRGRCRYCESAISVQYPLIEAGTAVIFVALALAPIALVSKILALPIAALLLAIGVYDLRTTIIPDVWVALCGALALFVAVFDAVPAGLPIIPVLLAGPIAASPLFALWLISRGEWMGLGDPKLALAMGWLLGAYDGLAAVLFAFILGALVSLPLLFLSSEYWRGMIRDRTFVPIASPLRFFRKHQLSAPHVAGTERKDFIPNDDKEAKTPSVWGFTMKSEIPFGPFLVTSCFLVWFAQMYGFDVGIWNIAL